MAMFAGYLQYRCGLLLSTIFLININLLSTTNHIWQDYPAYNCDLTISAFEIQYLLNITECKEVCSDHTNCKGIVWYEYLKKDVPDPSRCYLLDKICDLNAYNSSPAVTSFWYNNISLYTQCINYPFLWSDKYADNCNYYSKYRVCDNSFNDSNKLFILTDYDAIYNFNAFQVCCSCYGSIFEYKPNEISFVLESVWKPSHELNIIDNMVCQSYDRYITNKNINFHNKWNINIFLAICNHLTIKAQNKFSTIYSIADNEYENVQSVDYKELNNFDCINNLFVDKTITFYVCNELDFTNYAYIIDISTGNNYTIYLNAHFIDINDFISNLKNNKIIFETKCNIETLLNNNNKSNIMASLLCEYNTDSPTNYPTIEPTKYPTTARPTLDPTISPSSAPTYSPTGYPTDSPTPSIYYSDKTQVTAFCLTFFFGIFGAGRWYVGEEVGASFQLIMFVLSGCLLAFAIYWYNDYESKNGNRALGVSGSICCGLFIWWIVDLALIGQNKIYDDDGLALDPW